MYKTPGIRLDKRHISTSSSVYSPIESEFAFQKSQEAIIEEVSEDLEENVERDGSGSVVSEDTDHFVSYLNFRQFDSESSNMTYKTYTTAYGGSDKHNDSSIKSESDANRSISAGSDSIDKSWQYDDDATPKFDNERRFDDETPIIGSDDFFKDSNMESNSMLATERLVLPQKELSEKFKRLSVALNQKNMSASDDSHSFLNSFQQNVERANSCNEGQNGRTSICYNKIRNSVYDGKSDEERGGNKDSQSILSTLSSVSGRSSVISNSYRVGNITENDNLSQSRVMHETNNNQRNDENSTRYTYRIGSHSRGSSWSHDSDSFQGEVDVPTRKDIIEKVEKMIPESQLKNIDDKEKVRLYIKAEKMSQNDANDVSSRGLNISYNGSVLDPRSHSLEKPNDNDTTKKDVRESVKSVSLFSDDLSALFVRALHSFDSSTLKLESDISICLSFEKDDIAFIHTIDESGWGEVTLIESLQRGWIPMNYFSTAIYDEDEREPSSPGDDYSNYITNGKYLKILFHSCGKFLLNPLCHETRFGKFTFSIKVINSIRDGVRVLLQETDCLSRSNEIVTKREVVRKARKLLLADWYNLMVKANEYKGSSNFEKIEILTLMIYQVIRRAVEFLHVWTTESGSVIKRTNERKLQGDITNYPLLSSPPMAGQRVFEIHGLLYSYLALIIGRLDLIEHNAAGCEMLEGMTHQIILLLRELLFISKIGSDFSSSKPKELDGALDSLLALVSDLVTCVKCLVVKTLNESEEEILKNKKLNQHADRKIKENKDYYYTQEGGDLIQIASKIFRAVCKTISSIRKLIQITGDFRLSSERKYPDYSKIKFEPEQFIKNCSLGIMHADKARENNELLKRPMKSTARSRYSLIRVGRTGDLGFSEDGTMFLNDILKTENNCSFSANSEFEKFTVDPETNSSKNRYNLRNELLIDKQGNLLGASFRGLVYTLTDEESPPEYFFVSTFFICFRGFANGIDLIEEFITRFEVNTFESSDSRDVSEQVLLKNRRKLIVKMFQIWMESYWNAESDSCLLNTLINFFNEGVSKHLILESMKLLEIAAKLSSKPLTENQRTRRRGPENQQLVKRAITIVKPNKKNSIYGCFASSSMTDRYSKVGDYDLTRVSTTSSSTSSQNSLSLPLSLDIGNETSSSALLTKGQIVMMEKIILTSRAILGTNWCREEYLDKNRYIPVRVGLILDNWFDVCDQSWVLANYKPILLEFNSLEIAKQLTLIESNIFCSIRPDELLNENYTSKRAHLRLAPNVRKSLLFTNSLSGYILESILQPGLPLRQRVNCIKIWLKVAISCLYLRNFNSLAVIATALQSHLVTRLTELWENISEKYKDLYEYLSQIVHPQKNYNVYRSKLKTFLLNSEEAVPIVPYFSLFLLDLTFVTEGNPDYREANSFLHQKLINIDKYLKITRIISDIERLQILYPSDARSTSSKNHKTDIDENSSLSGKSFDAPDYNIKPVPSLQEVILLELWKVCQLNKKEADRAWKLSCKIHPRDSK